MIDMTPIQINFVNAMPLPALLVRPDERIVAANQPARDLLKNDCVNRPVITILRAPDMLEGIEGALMKSRKSSVRHMLRDGGRDYVYAAHIAPVSLPDGDCAMITFEDRTDIETANEMRRDFVANVSHELRTPLTSLMGFIETLRGPAKNDPKVQDRFLGIMESEAGRMAHLVQDLLHLSRVEEDERIRPSTMVDIAQVMETCVNAIQPVADNSKVTLNLTKPAQPVMVPADADQLRQVFNNLVENAIKYGGREKNVDIVISEPTQLSQLRASGVTVSVTDYGEGIASYHIPRLTERFYRVDRHRSREVGGTGLGLAIVKHIAVRHRGKLVIRSTEGEGSTFEILLPTQ